MITRSRPDQLVTDAWRCIRGDLKPRSLGILCLLALTLLLGAQNASAQLYYDSNGQTAELTVAQLYYEGYWNFVRLELFSAFVHTFSDYKQRPIWFCFNVNVIRSIDGSGYQS